MAYRLSTAGLNLAPVISNIGSVHSGGGGDFWNANSVGYMKVSPAGNKLALGIRDANFELFDFNTSTGQVSNYIPLPQFYRSYGVEFSTDGSRLYGTNLDGHEIYQFNLLAGSGVNIAASATVIGYTSGYGGALQLGPDSKIYVSQDRSTHLGVINNPNALGTTCDFQAQGVYLGGMTCRIGLPNNRNSAFQVVSPVPPIKASFINTNVCIGTSTAFTATIEGGVEPLTANWNFGDSASGGANIASGRSTVHTYSAPGAYTVTLTINSGNAIALTITKIVTVAPLPTVNLGPDVQRACIGESVILNAGTQPPGTSIRWQDGSNNQTLTASASGQYYVDVTNALGCTVRSSVKVQIMPLPNIQLGPSVQQLCEGRPLTLSAGPQSVGSSYRWQDGSTNPTLTVQAAGFYTVSVTSPSGCTDQASTRVELAPSPVVNIGRDTAICDDQSILLKAGPQPAGYTYHWQDGSTGSTFSVTSPGIYEVEVTSSNGCISSDKLIVKPADCPFDIPNIITPNGDNSNETFVLRGLRASEWRCQIFTRWGRNIYNMISYDNNWNAEGQANGIYYYLLTHSSTGKQIRGWIQVNR
ncbi:hypothetical protein GCM10027348_17350 [Hymenobacter tenuis]